MILRPTRREILLAGGAMGAAMLPRGVLAADEPQGWDRAAMIAAQVRPPRFPSRVFPITDYGAKGDGVTKNSVAIARAIEACHQAGGGRVLVPAGRFLTGAVHLKSNVELHVAKDATLLFSTDTADYPVVMTRWEGVDVMSYSPLIYAYEQKNIAVTGSGLLDGQASEQHWWSWKGPGWSGAVKHGWREGMPHQDPARKTLFQMAEVGVPATRRIFADGAYLRPPMIQPFRCENVLIEGVTLRRAPFWHVHPVFCTNVMVRKLDIGTQGPNNDGCNPESTRMMVIEDCVFNTGDDCMAIDSGRNAEGRRIGIPSQDILVRRCKIDHGHGALVIGSVISGGVRNIFWEDCDIRSETLGSAIRIKNNAARGGVLENLYYRNITVRAVKHSVILCDFNYEEGSKGNFKPVLRNVVIDNVRAADAPRIFDLQGLTNAPLGDIAMRDCSFDGVTKPSVLRHAPKPSFENIVVNGKRVKEPEFVVLDDSAGRCPTGATWPC